MSPDTNLNRRVKTSRGSGAQTTTSVNSGGNAGTIARVSASLFEALMRIELQNRKTPDGVT